MDQNPQTIAPKASNNTGLKITAIVTSILAICGVGFGVYGMIKNNTTTKSESDFKVEIVDEDGQKSTIESEKITVADDGKTITISDNAAATKNFVIKNDDSTNYRLKASVSASSNNATYSVELSVADGEVIACTLMQYENGTNRYVKDCPVPTGFSGKISQIIDAGEGQSFFQTMAFIMEDGSVSYVKSQDLVDNAVNDTATQVQGTLKINGAVIDVEHAHAMPKGSEGIGAYVTTFFILSDGTYVKYSDSLLN